MSDVAQIIAEIEAQMAAKPDVYAIVSEVDLRALLDEVKRKDAMLVTARSTSDAHKAHAEAAEAGLSRLRTLIDGHDPDNPDEGPRCRDCADNFGICEHSGWPCDPQKAAEAKVKGLQAELARLRTQQAAEIERLKIDVNRWHAVVDIVSVNAGLGSASLDPIKMGPELGKRVRSVVAAEARLREAVDDLRMIDASIFNDNGDVTWSPLEIRANFRALMAKINDWTDPMSDDAMIEAMARAMCEADHGHRKPRVDWWISVLSEEGRNDYREPSVEGEVWKVVKRLLAEEDRAGKLFDFVVIQRAKHEGTAFADINQIKHALAGRDPVLTDAADLLTRMVKENERLRIVDAESVPAHLWQKEKARSEKFKDQVIDTCKRAETAEARADRLAGLVKEAAEVMRQTHEVMHRLTAIIPGNDRALAETTDAMASARSLLPKLENPDAAG